MGTWHYVISREQLKTVGSDDELSDWFEIREVHFDDDGKLVGWSKDPMEPGGESLREIIADLGHMYDAQRRLLLDLTLDPPALVDPDTVLAPSAVRDWVTDRRLSPDETHRRFDELGPEPTTGPPA